MDRQSATDLDVIKRIVALLFALALLAERAAVRPPAVRIFIHSLLLTAQFAALTLFLNPADIVADATRETLHGAEPADLIRVAVSLRALAMLLAAGCTAPSGGRERVFRRLGVDRPRVLRLDSRPARLNDTS